MALNAGFVEHVRELLEGVGPVQIRRMFGGAGVYRGDVMFALVVGEDLFLKTDEATRPRFEAAGSEPFIYVAKARGATATSYWRLPAAAADDPAEALSWARLALDAALKKKAPRTRAPAADLGPGPWDPD